MGKVTFQSTLPVRGATSCAIGRTVLLIFQSTLPVRGATQPRQPFLPPVNISIHAPRAGSDV